jgi:hypothetical protein
MEQEFVGVTLEDKKDSTETKSTEEKTLPVPGQDG